MKLSAAVQAGFFENRNDKNPGGRMIGAIAGDVIGSVFERNPIKTTEFRLFSDDSTYTDDTVLTIAIAYSILNTVDYATALKTFARQYPRAGYGMSFYRWVHSSETRPYYSWGNGAAMRASPIGFAYDSIEEVLLQARNSAAVTHNHPEGIQGAQATALAVRLARAGRSKDNIRAEISGRFNYNLDRTLGQIRPSYLFDISCQGTVPEAIIAFMESENYENAIRKAISLGGDSDTIACITGGIAQAFYKDIPEKIVMEVKKRLPQQFLEILDEFSSKYSP